MRNEAARSGRRRRREAERVWSARAQSRRHICRARQCQRKYVRNRARDRGEGRRDHRGGAGHQGRCLAAHDRENYVG